MPGPTVQAALPYETFDFTHLADEAGSLYVGTLAQLGLAAFDRICFITGVPAGGSRGGHAHKRQVQYVVCVRGGVDVRLESRRRRAVVPLRQAGRGLCLPAGSWRELMNFAPETVLLLLAAEPFDEGDYIRDYSAFVAWESRAS